MSEGPEVKIVADKIAEAALNEPIEDIKNNKIDSQMKRKILQARIEYVKTYGKNIVIKFSSCVYLRNHMMLWGKWRIYERDDFDKGVAKPPPIRSFNKVNSKSSTSVAEKKIESDVRNDKRIRLIIITANKVLVEFNGPILEFSSEDPSLRPPISLLGPDGLSLKYDKNKVVSNLIAKSKIHSYSLISDCLLDQQIVSGIGNKYKSEILFLNGIYPFEKTSSLSINKLDELAASIPIFLDLGYKNRGYIRSIAKGDSNQYQTDKHWVFRRSGRPCLKCGSKIISERTLTKRLTFWCPQCQAK